MRMLDKIRMARVVYSAKIRQGRPPWATDKPVSLQLDTQTRCNLKCVYCNPQSCFVNKVDKVDMDYGDLLAVLDELKRNKVYLSYCNAYMNGDTLLEKRLPQITADIKRRLGCPISVFTNGAEYKNRMLLLDPNLDEIRFTISAHNRDLYAKIHGRDRWTDVLLTLGFVKTNKFRGQTVGVNYVLFDMNALYLWKWKTKFKDFNQEIRCLHSGDTREKSNDLSDSSDILAGYRKLFFDRLIQRERPCACFGNMSIGVNGHLLQCCDTPYKFDYGHIQEIDLMEMWRKRLDLGLKAEGCRDCNQKNPNWKSLFEKYVWEV